MEPQPPAAPPSLAKLAASRRLSDRTAARLARHLAGQRPWTPVDTDAALAAQLDVSAAQLDVSPATAGHAKRTLRELGIITKSGTSYYVKHAPPATATALTPPGYSQVRPAHDT
jgi:hypothetical protein